MREERCVCTFFFFFFLNFGLTRPFRPIQADTADTDRVGPILAASAPIWRKSAPTSAASARFGTCHVARRGPTRHGRAVCGVPAASDAGAPALGPRPCMPVLCSLFYLSLGNSIDLIHKQNNIYIYIVIFLCNLNC